MSFRKLIASDIDGTLLPEESNLLPEEVLRQVEHAWECGCLFIAASGRQYPSLRSLFAPVAEHMAFIAENGGGLYYQDKLVAARSLDRTLAKQLARYVYDIPGCEFLAGGVETCAMPKSQVFADHLDFVQRLQYRTISSLDDLPEQIMKIAVWCATGSAPLEPRFRADWGDRVRIAVSGSTWIDFNASDKGEGLASACAYFGVDQADTIAFGDNWNDVPMLDFAACPYLMSTGNPELMDRYSLRCDNVPRTLDEILKNI